MQILTITDALAKYKTGKIAGNPIGELFARQNTNTSDVVVGGMFYGWSEQELRRLAEEFLTQVEGATNRPRPATVDQVLSDFFARSPEAATAV